MNLIKLNKEKKLFPKFIDNIKIYIAKKKHTKRKCHIKKKCYGFDDLFFIYLFEEKWF